MSVSKQIAPSLKGNGEVRTLSGDCKYNFFSKSIAVMQIFCHSLLGKARMVLDTLRTVSGLPGFIVSATSRVQT
jgi:hypothetical protein